MVTEPSNKDGWRQVARPTRAFAGGQANLHGKTEAYEIFRHPEGGRKDFLRWPTQLWQHPAKALVFMKLFCFAPHYSGAVWRN